MGAFAPWFQNILLAGIFHSFLSLFISHAKPLVFFTWWEGGGGASPHPKFRVG